MTSPGSETSNQDIAKVYLHAPFFRIDKLANSCNVMSAMGTSHALDTTHVIQRYYSHSLSNQTKNGCNRQCQPHFNHH